MFDKVQRLFKFNSLRHHPLMAAFVLGLIGLLGVTVFLQNQSREREVVGENIETVNTVSTNVLPASIPQKIRIPKLDLEADFGEPLGITETKEIEVPKDYERVGYYQYGPTPGEIGPAVVLGHVDSVDGPAVFYSLGQLVPGDEVMIDRADGTTAVFVVTSLERPKQSDFPTEAVYGNIDFAGLRLITCTGIYDRGKMRYTNNLIVYAALKEA